MPTEMKTIGDRRYAPKRCRHCKRTWRQVESDDEALGQVPSYYVLWAICGDCATKGCARPECKYGMLGMDLVPKGGATRWREVAKPRAGWCDHCCIDPDWMRREEAPSDIHRELTHLIWCEEEESGAPNCIYERRFEAERSAWPKVN